ncbi:MAG TPA: hypothetical protein VLX64_06180 [Thermoplasmata archaeon]|nr:hypothetical protein [Thermoplasmata archaeon]
MAPARRPVDLTVERSIAVGDAPPVVVRLTVRVDPDDATGGSPNLPDALRRLREELDAAIAAVVPEAATPARADRSLDELIETYRPRQPELVDLLRDEGELTRAEHALLRGHLAAAVPPPAAGGVPIAERPIAAAPLEGDRAPASPRPVEELLRKYQIESLKQAGAVRARRQISFEEYMALKRHFEGAPPAAP